MAQMAENSEVFDEYADDYSTVMDKSVALSGEEGDFFIELKIKLLHERFKRIAHLPLRILDYGCGTGRSAMYVRKYFPNALFSGTDPSMKSINVATKNNPKDHFFCLKEGQDLGQEQYDLVFSTVVFHHIDEKDHVQTLQMIHQSLRQKGRVVIFEHNPYNPLTVRVVKNCPFDEGVILLKPKYTRSILTKANFKMQTLDYYFFFPQALSFLRGLERYLSWLPLGAQYFAIGKKIQQEGK